MGGDGPILEKTRLVHLGNVQKPPHPQFSTLRAPTGSNESSACEISHAHPADLNKISDFLVPKTEK